MKFIILICSVLLLIMPACAFGQDAGPNDDLDTDDPQPDKPQPDSRPDDERDEDKEVFDAELNAELTEDGFEIKVALINTTDGEQNLVFPADKRLEVEVEGSDGDFLKNKINNDSAKELILEPSDTWEYSTLLDHAGDFDDNYRMNITIALEQPLTITGIVEDGR